MRFFRSSKFSKTTLEITQKLATGKTASHSSYSYVVTYVGHYALLIHVAQLFKNNRSMNASNVKKHCFVMLNVK